MLRILKKLIPQPLKSRIRCLLGKQPQSSTHLRVSTSYADIGEAGPLIEIFRQLEIIPGWFNVDDCGHFFMVLSHQSAMGITGDLLEIGSFHGRSTALMARCLEEGENIVVCDAFELDTDDKYANKPSPENLISNVERVNPGLGKDRIFIHKCLSKDLQLEAEEKFRFVHVDGGHSAEQAYFDLQLASNHLLPRGVIVMDDYNNRLWPEVTEGTDRFLKDNDEFRVLADLNRHGAYGRKLYLIKTK